MNTSSTHASTHSSAHSSTHLPLIALIGSLSACTFLVGLALDLPDLKVMVKAIPVLCMALWVVLSGADRRIAIGLVFGALGDIFLSFPDTFLPGMVAFAIGHGLYVWAFWRWQAGAHVVLSLPVIAYLAMALPLMLPGTGQLAIPVVGYMGIIGAMIWRATVVATQPTSSSSLHRAAHWLPFIGALLFAFSDTLIGLSRFATPLPGVTYPIILTYWGGQFFIAASAIARK
jgi:alkenylglycerophosphocholine hydrolase